MKTQRINKCGNALVVDDDRATCLMLKAALDSYGCTTTIANSVDDAIAVVERDHIQIIISDWEMPGKNGIDLCRAVRGMNLPYYTYFILLTSHSEPENIVEGLAAGADDYVTKPYNPAELQVRVEAGMRLIALDTRDVTIFALAKLAESRDPETGAHLERVRTYAMLIAQELLGNDDFPEVDDEFINLIYATSPLHDIGKVAIPDCVLLKAGQLSDAEFDIMKTHTTAGATTLNAALQKYPEQRFLQMAHDIALSHHERFDGSGYPNGIEGDGIPLAARIVSVADVYDALVSKRVYKSAFEHQVAAQIIRDGAGGQFDSRLIEIFNRLENRFIEIHKQHADEPLSAAA